MFHFHIHSWETEDTEKYTLDFHCGEIIERRGTRLRWCRKCDEVQWELESKTYQCGDVYRWQSYPLVEEVPRKERTYAAPKV